MYVRCFSPAELVNEYYDRLSGIPRSSRGSSMASTIVGRYKMRMTRTKRTMPSMNENRLLRRQRRHGSKNRQATRTVVSDAAFELLHLSRHVQHLSEVTRNRLATPLHIFDAALALFVETSVRLLCLPSNLFLLFLPFADDS
jgi:hypothetical protein